ncbi:MAG: hypothetical protein U0414_42835 [Polyangiaceae bacterium]
MAERRRAATASCIASVCVWVALSMGCGDAAKKSSMNDDRSGKTRDRSSSPAPSSSERTPASESEASGSPSAESVGNPADEYFRLVDRLLAVLETTPDCHAFGRAFVDYRRDFPEGTATRVVHANDLDHPYEIGFGAGLRKPVELEAFRALHAERVASVRQRFEALERRMSEGKGRECPEMVDLLEDFLCIDMLRAKLPM